MKVSELQALLSRLDADSEVLIATYQLTDSNTFFSRVRRAFLNGRNVPAQDGYAAAPEQLVLGDDEAIDVAGFEKIWPKEENDQ